MKALPRIFCLLLLCLVGSHIRGQGIVRSSGFGFRASYWKMGETGLRIIVDNSTQTGSVDIEGFGAWLNYYSAMSDRWYLEFNAGGVSRVNVRQTDLLAESIDIDAVVPLLFGLRHDILSSAIPTRLQPYITGGSGGYWRSQIQVRQVNGVDQQTVTSSNFTFGGYLGGGLNIPFTTRFGLNFDVKYHFVDFTRDTDISGAEFGVGLIFMWGQKREMFRVKETRLLVRDIYPAYQQFYSTYPLALVRVRNTAGYPIEVNLTASIPGYSSQPRQSGYVKLKRGEERDLEVKVHFRQDDTAFSTRKPAVLNIAVEGRANTSTTRTLSEQLFVYTRNSWDGSLDKLGFFLTPDSPEMLQLTRGLISSDSLTGSAELPPRLLGASRIFQYLQQHGVHYQSDPDVPFYEDDRVQFASETLQLNSGDCDDLVVLYGSLLQSMGIPIAIVQVRDPAKPLAHLYLIYDSGLTPGQAGLISSNEKRYIIREDSTGKTGVWIPVETTLIARGYNAAWEAAALSYLQEGLIRQGLEEGWVTIFDIR